MFLILCIMFLTSCSTSSSEIYNQQLQNWVGMSQEALYHSWGEPANEIFTTPNTKIVTYIKIDNGPISGNTEPYADQINYEAIETPNFGLPPENDTYYCKTSFTIVNSEIVDYSFNGDDCIAED